ncbi:MAG: hypothetical protein V4724_26925 [Pseudomonadota bacterium]
MTEIIVITGGGMGADWIGQLLAINGKTAGIVVNITSGAGRGQQVLELDVIKSAVQPYLEQKPARPKFGDDRPYLKRKKGRS